jgi:hypothetical protein
MKRYYIAKIIGDGTETNPYRSAIHKYQDLQYESGEIPSDPVTGAPLVGYVLAVVHGKDHSRIAADPDIDALPDFPLDGKMSSLHTVTKNKFINALKKHGIDTSSIGSVDGYREAIRLVGKSINPSFDENNFDLNG